MWKIDKFNVFFNGKQCRFIAIFDLYREDYVLDEYKEITCVVE